MNIGRRRPLLIRSLCGLVVTKMLRNFTKRTFSVGVPLSEMLQNAQRAAFDLAAMPHEKIDKIFHDVSLKIGQQRVHLAASVVAETKRGVFEDKCIKNLFASENVYNAFKTWRPPSSSIDILEPYGVIGALLPVTNPTSTAIYKTLMALRSRNAIILCPHPSAFNCTKETAMILSEAATLAGAPSSIIQVLSEPSKENVSTVMNACDLVWATGGADMVSVASSLGKPALVGGPGNAVAMIDDLADVDSAVSAILTSKTFDNGMICAAEQACVALSSVYDDVKNMFVQRGSLLLNEADAAKLVGLMRKDGGTHICKVVVGQSATAIAEMANITLPPHNTFRCLLVEANKDNIGPSDPLSCEKMAPILALYRAETFEEGLDICRRLVQNGGVGHVSSLHTSNQLECATSGAIVGDRIHFSRCDWRPLQFLFCSTIMCSDEAAPGCQMSRNTTRITSPSS
jgi:acetaldehyde dehydrogenase/alcohol dehydrogenase